MKQNQMQILEISSKKILDKKHMRSWDVNKDIYSSDRHDI